MRHSGLPEARQLRVDLPRGSGRKRNRRRGVCGASSSRASAGKVCEADAPTATLEGNSRLR